MLPFLVFALLHVLAASLLTLRYFRTGYVVFARVGLAVGLWPPLFLVMRMGIASFFHYSRG